MRVTAAPQTTAPVNRIITKFCTRYVLWNVLERSSPYEMIFKLIPHTLENDIVDP